MGLLHRAYALSLVRRPVAAQRLVTAACDMKCPHCDSAAGKRVVGELSSEEAKHLVIDPLVELGCPLLVLAGGELLLRRDIPELVAYARDRGLDWAMHTHGMHVPRYEALFREHPSVLAAISLDGDRSFHDAFRGRAGSFDAALPVADLLAAAGCQEVVLGTTVTRNNADHVARMFPLVSASRADSWGLHQHLDADDREAIEALVVKAVAGEPSALDAVERELGLAHAAIRSLLEDRESPVLQTLLTFDESRALRRSLGVGTRAHLRVASARAASAGPKGLAVAAAVLLQIAGAHARLLGARARLVVAATLPLAHAAVALIGHQTRLAGSLGRRDAIVGGVVVRHVVRCTLVVGPGPIVGGVTIPRVGGRRGRALLVASVSEQRGDQQDRSDAKGATEERHRCPG